ncbi:hypothetical protein N9K75_02210 [bacterium]|nr:hypothetical protein [bacterium]
MSKETFEEWCHSTGMDDARVVSCDMVSMEVLYECWNHQQKKIQTLEAKLAKAVELIDCTSDRWGKCKCRSCKFLESLEEGGDVD